MLCNCGKINSKSAIAAPVCVCLCWSECVLLSKIRLMRVSVYGYSRFKRSELIFKMIQGHWHVEIDELFSCCMSVINSVEGPLPH